MISSCDDHSNMLPRDEYSIEAAGVAVRRCASTIMNALARGELAGVRRGRRVYITARELNRWSEEKGLKISSGEVSRLAFRLARSGMLHDHPVQVVHKELPDHEGRGDRARDVPHRDGAGRGRWRRSSMRFCERPSSGPVSYFATEVPVLTDRSSRTRYSDRRRHRRIKSIRSQIARQLKRRDLNNCA